MDPNSEPAASRRSGRARKPNTRYMEVSSDDELNSSTNAKAKVKRTSPGPNVSKEQQEETPNHEEQSGLKGSPELGEGATVIQPRRNTKRKAAPEVFDVPDNVLGVSLAPWGENELMEWPSWTEVESDPVFFNRILRLLGIREAKVREVLSVDEESLLLLPEPLYGLVFLFQVMDEEEEDLEPDEEFELWFANQVSLQLLLFHRLSLTVLVRQLIMRVRRLPYSTSS